VLHITTIRIQVASGHNLLTAPCQLLLFPPFLQTGPPLWINATTLTLAGPGTTLAFSATPSDSGGHVNTTNAVFRTLNLGTSFSGPTREILTHVDNDASTLRI